MDFVAVVAAHHVAVEEDLVEAAVAIATAEDLVDEVDAAVMAHQEVAVVEEDHHQVVIIEPKALK